MARQDDITNWSNAKKARIFVRIISYLVAQRGGEVRIPVKLFNQALFAPVGFAREGDDLLVVVDMDDVQTTAGEPET